jgi:hypothetical protein
MVPRKRWPNHVEDARLEALANARRGLNAITPMFTEGRDPETIRRVAIANDALHRIIEELQAVGPRGIEKPPLLEGRGFSEKRD